MARYHFHLVDHDVRLDLRAVELASEAKILDFAEQLATGLLRAPESAYAQNPDAWEIRVTNDNGVEVFCLALSEVAGKR
ncbi:MAG TPA: hypothetical protein VKX28_20890 [Xanthobacteraceae bacterium]|nr:hypothetical protein [Xanthobacteraceae bacterium]